jgi:hypothetical protein
MNAETLEALKGSIRKWESIVNDDGKDKGADNCDLCQLFYGDECCGCPICLKTGEIYCRETPHDQWVNHGENEFIDKEYFKVFDDKSKELAQAELDFLKSLLPNEDI